MKGGSRRNAGRPGWRIKISSCRRLDVRFLQRFGYMLAPAQRTVVHWPDGFAASVVSSKGLVRLRYALTHSEREIEVDQAVAITHTAGTYGGRRPWFACPRCGRRVAFLYLDQRPGCRQCHAMTYPSQSEDWMRRKWRKEVMIERRLAAGKDKWDYTRPKGMHKSTFVRLNRQRLYLEGIREEAAMRLMALIEH